ncbi:DUF2017 family protein [Amycolatopsis sp. NPDC059021]|uniref:DUF2017 family protein n=1 Tax=Amycolatopsis sp. NPDC059021 TaxID=3346704 RepID=UPI0036720814
MEDYIRVTGVGGTVQLAMSENAADTVRHILAELESALAEAREAPRPRRLRLPDKRLFPDAYGDAAESARFRERHGTRMREEVGAALERVRLAWPDQPWLTLDGAAVRDWLIVLAHAQTSYLRKPRWRASPGGSSKREGEVKVAWLMSLQGCIATAALAPAGMPVVLDV